MTEMTDNLFATPRIERSDRADGTIVLRSEEALSAYPTSLIEAFREAAERHPNQLLAAERSGGEWSGVTWTEARQKADALAQGLLDRGLGPERPLMILSGNSVWHLLLILGAHTAAVPVVSVSPAYSLASRDHARLLSIAAACSPGLIAADDSRAFAPALRTLRGAGVEAEAASGAEVIEMLAATPTEAVQRAVARQTPETVLKVLFTSGSTGTPKGVVTTNRMLCSNQQALAQIWPFLTTSPPVLVDWLPWSHTFGGSHNLNQVLTFGGTLYIDDGKPTPADFPRTIDALRSVQPTVYYNVPVAYAMLVDELERDREFAAQLFERTRLFFYAAAALPQSIWDRLQKLIDELAPRPIPLTASWGTTETAPLATSAHFEGARCGCIGVPVPGVELKLVPTGGKLEVAVGGPGVTTDYLGDTETTKRAFDGDGFYRTGDAARFVDDADPSRGLMFDGRIAEDFKLITGTWVSVGNLRSSLLSACEILKDVVITGHDRDFVGAIAWIDESAARQAAGIDAGGARKLLSQRLERHNAGRGSSQRVERMVIAEEPPSIDAGEITDKGYVNQRRVLERRADLVARLYAEDTEGIIEATGTTTVSTGE